MTATTVREKVGDKLVTVHTRVEVDDLQVDYDDILESVKIEYDDCMEAPWESDDGWAHELVGAHSRADRGSMRAMIRHNRDYAGDVVRIQPCAGLPDWRDFHRRGASKQAARQLEAAALRHNMDQLVKWYDDGWQWFSVVGKFTHGGEKFRAACGGIDTYEFAKREMVPEIAGEIVEQLEKAGYEVINQPVPEKLFKNRWTLAGWKEHLRDNLKRQNMEPR